MHVPVGPAGRHGPTPTTVIDSSEDSAERSRVVIVLDVDDDADVRHGVVIIDLC